MDNSSGVRLSILILNWNGTTDTSNLIRQIADQASTIPSSDLLIETLVLDNGSSEPLPDWWSAIEGVSVTRLEENIGYSGGMSLLAGEACGTYLWLLNNDTTLAPNSLADVLAVLDDGFVGARLPVVYNEDGSIQSRDSTWSPVLGWRAGKVAQLEHAPIFGDIFVAPILNRFLVHDLKLRPSALQTDGEDLDACYALAMCGYPVVRAPSIVLFHRKSSSKPRDPLVRYIFDCQGVRNILASAMINYSASSFWAIPLLAGKLMIRELIMRQPRQVVISPRALRELMRVPRGSISLFRSLATTRSTRQRARKTSDYRVWRTGKS